MPRWVTIVAEDLADYSVGAKVDALRQKALASGQTDPFDQIMTDVVATMRGLMSAGGRNQLSKLSDSVPPEAKTHFCWLVIEAMQARLPGLALKDEERRMIDRAWQWLRDVAKRDIAISQPDDPIDAPVQATGGISVVTSNTRLMTRETQAGL